MKTKTLILTAILALLAIATHAQPYAIVTLDASNNTNYTYKIYYGPASTVYTNFVQAGTNLTATVTNLAFGSTNFFVATATDPISKIESDPSAEVSAAIPSKPAHPTGLKATVVAVT